jgi:acyl-CoA synthetase (AMP-forming)/AMP-acid ligase II
MEIVEIDPEADAPKRDPKNKNFCTRVAAGAPGEYLVKLDPANIKTAYLGYYGNEKATKSKIMRDVLVKGDAYFRTGDLIRRDREGRIWFCDRLGDTFRWKSENVSTNEVAEVLGAHPAIVEANVYGIELPHHDGRAGCVAAVLNRGVDPHLLHGLAHHALKGLPHYAVPLFVRVVKEMQATGNNKQQKHVLRAEGVEPAKVSAADQLYWLNGGTYKPFGKREWEALQSGAVKL